MDTRTAVHGFALGLALGACLGLGTASLLTVGPLFLVPIALLALLLGRKSLWRSGGPGVLSGASTVFFFLAFINRHGPGTYCHDISDSGQECVEQTNPALWLTLGLLLLLGGVTAGILVTRSSRRDGSPLRPTATYD